MKMHRCIATVAGAASVSLAMPVCGGGQVVPVSPFDGPQVESFEAFAYGEVPGVPQEIFGGAGTIVFDGSPDYYLWVYSAPGSAWDWPLGSGVVAELIDGERGMALDGEVPDRAIIRFEAPIERFGGYWAVSAGWGTIRFDFFDARDVLIDSVDVAYDAVAHDGALAWHGWSSTVPVSRVDISGNYAAFDGLQATPACPADLDGDGGVAVSDLLIVLAAWSTPDGDVTGDGTTDVADLLAVLSAWGACE